MEEQGKPEEEDYMADLSLFLPTGTSQSSQKHSSETKTLSHKPSTKKLKTQNWQERRRIDRERKQREEDEKTLANIESAIPQSNIGFKMLKQMGYNPGSALGKDGSGRAEPVGIDIRRSRAGIGREDPVREKLKKEEYREVMDKKKEEELLTEFGVRKKSQWRSRRIVVNFHKAKAVVDQLENREIVEPEKKANEEENEDEEEEEVITEEAISELGTTNCLYPTIAYVEGMVMDMTSWFGFKNTMLEDLYNILTKLRDEHRYCLFCGFQYESIEALLSNCPGIDEDDH